MPTLISVTRWERPTTVNNNTFTNLNVNTTGSVTFIQSRHDESLTATGTLSVNSNSIVTGFNKGQCGRNRYLLHVRRSVIYLRMDPSITYNLNNFSNVTLTGVTAVLALSDANGASSCQRTDQDDHQ